MNKAKYLNDTLTSFESEDIISNRLMKLKLEDIGSKEFILHHSYLNKINMQVIKNILSGTEDQIMEQFIQYDKFKPLIEELFTMNAFKQCVYPHIVTEMANLSSIKSYLVLYHEACIVNLIENFVYSITACEAAADYIVDIIEYAYKMITKYLTYKAAHDKEQVSTQQSRELTMEEIANQVKKISTKAQASSEENVSDLQRKNSEIEFNIAMCCINILRYISDHLEQLPFPVRHHMMNVKDVPMLFVTVMESRPWERKVKVKDGSEKMEIFENNNWVEYKNIAHKIPKLEAQVWITVYNLFMVQENNKKYEINQYRQTQLLRLRKFFSEKLYDQIPQMANFYRSLEEMALVQFNSTLTDNPFIVEMIPVLANSKMFKMTNDQAKQLGSTLIHKYFKISDAQLRKELEPMNEVYSIDNMEYFMDDPKCANCGKDATSRCSRCKSEWYCSKECQVKRWKTHKELCKTLMELYKEEEKEKKEKKSVQEMLDIVGKGKGKEEDNVEVTVREGRTEGNADKKVYVQEVKQEEKKQEVAVQEEAEKEVVVRSKDLDDLD